MEVVWRALSYKKSAAEARNRFRYVRMGLDPAAARFIGVKNPMNFRLG
jgi:hypothetical protein